MIKKFFLSKALFTIDLPNLSVLPKDHCGPFEDEPSTL